MLLGIRYKGGFISHHSVRWDVEIFCEGYSGKVEPLVFPAEDPLVIEWSETSKEEPVQGSVATLKVESPGDRSFIDLYTVKPGGIAIKIYRNSALWWCGNLDPEFYEEPYERASKYDVTLTFTDFGILDRIKWSSRDFVKLDKIVKDAIHMATQEYTDYELMCTTCAAKSDFSIRLDEYCIAGDNFFDEDDQPSTWREVLDGILQPLALRIIQRGGRIMVYDVNFISQLIPTDEVYWTSDSQTLSADKIFNSVTVNFSPYENNKILDGAIDRDKLTESGSRTEYRIDDANMYPGFFITPCQKGSPGVPFDVYNAELVKIESVYSGNDDTAICIGRHGGVGKSTQTIGAFKSLYPNGENGGTTYFGGALGTSDTGYIRPVGANSDDFRLKISLEALVDVRYNPFESASRNNEEGNYDRLKNWCNFGYIPASLRLTGKSGRHYYYSNISTVKGDGYALPGGAWYNGIEPLGKYLLAYYNTGNRKSDTGFGGWQTNKPVIGYYRGSLPTIYEKLGSGDIIPLPPEAGHLQLQIGSSLFQFDYDREEKDIYSRLKWYMIKDPLIKLVNKYGKEIDEVDIEYTGWLDRDAKEELSLNTIVGTSDKPLPSARGMLLHASTLDQVYTLSRGGVTDCIERLLIGTIYSNYSTRHTKLSGEAAIIDTPLPVMTEANQPTGTHFMLAEEIQYCIEDTAEVVLVEVLPDNYEGLEYE